ncbi:hypothetical protein BH20BAC1_BH20BAC1_01640 [soil metagenome]
MKLFLTDNRFFCALLLGLILLTSSISCSTHIQSTSTEPIGGPRAFDTLPVDGIIKVQTDANHHIVLLDSRENPADNIVVGPGQHIIWQVQPGSNIKKIKDINEIPQAGKPQIFKQKPQTKSGFQIRVVMQVFCVIFR